MQTKSRETVPLAQMGRVTAASKAREGSQRHEHLDAGEGTG
jgi:hypothetical protein